MRSIITALILLFLTYALSRYVMGAECTLAWDIAETVEPPPTSFRIYCGIELLAVVYENTAKVTLPDRPCEVSVVACLPNFTHPPVTLKVSYVTDQQSVDLKAWDTMHGYHREFLPGRRFYRTKIETPP